jgi:hypothetical protein
MIPFLLSCFFPFSTLSSSWLDLLSIERRDVRGETLPNKCAEEEVDCRNKAYSESWDVWFVSRLAPVEVEVIGDWEV